MRRVELCLFDYKEMMGESAKLPNRLQPLNDRRSPLPKLVHLQNILTGLLDTVDMGGLLY